MTKIKLNDDEERDLSVGQDLQSMVATPGWKRIKERLEGLAFHSWVDPREIAAGSMSKDEYLWRELNAFYAADNAKEIIDFVTKAINRAEFLQKKKNGEITTQRMGIGRTT